jgi:hypothetical protein
LIVGPTREQVDPVFSTESEAGPQERTNCIQPVVLVGRWRHGQPRVVGEQIQYAVNVGSDVRVGEPLRKIIFRSRLQRWLSVSVAP